MKNISNNKFPEINIRYNRFLDPVFIAYVKAEPRWKDIEIPSHEEVKKRIEKYVQEWDKYGIRILEGMTDVLELQFSRNIIDVHIVSLNPRQFSRPIVLKSGFLPSGFIISLTHELIHRLFAENSDIISPDTVQEIFHNETSTTANHIIVHAVLKYLYIDVLDKPELLQENKENSKKHRTKDYYRAWEIVEERGYKNIIEDMKKKY